MNRLLTLIWAIGVMVFASQAQAVTSKDATGATRTAHASDTSKKSYSKRKASTNRAHYTGKKSARTTKSYRSRSAKRTRTRTAGKVTHMQRHAHANARARGHALHGVASYYWQPQRVASGGWFNPRAMTAAHKTLPFGTRVKVTNKRNGRTVHVTINDRGPYIGGRIIDLSDAAAGAIGMKGAGVVPVSVEVVSR
jgi:rare lipoprotein A